jgi:hypothetical protein
MRRIAPVVMSSGVPSTGLTRWHPNPPLRSKHPKDEKESYRKRLNQRSSAQSPHSSGCLLRFAEAGGFYDDPEKCEFFNEEVKKLGLDPAKTTTFEWLELDDKVSHAQAAA